MADNCPSLEPWFPRPAFSDMCWISEAFARDTETLTRALQMSLSADSDLLAAAVTGVGGSCGGSPSFLVKPEPAASASDAEMAAPRRIRNPTLPPPVGKSCKRKSRASKRFPTTFITADPANFRQMVQQVTGVRFGACSTPAATETVLKPEPQRFGSQRVALPQSGCLPTLDTSAFFLDQAASASASAAGSSGPSPAGSHGSFASSVEGTSAGFDLEPFPCFPTLESWGVM